MELYNSSLFRFLLYSILISGRKRFENAAFEVFTELSTAEMFSREVFSIKEILIQSFLYIRQCERKFDVVDGRDSSNIKAKFPNQTAMLVRLQFIINLIKMYYKRVNSSESFNVMLFCNLYLICKLKKA